MYESEYLKLPVSAFSNQGGVKSNVLIRLPMLAEVPGAGWVAIAESELQGYSSMYLPIPLADGRVIPCCPGWHPGWIVQALR
jgi:alpha-glucosidase